MIIALLGEATDPQIRHLHQQLLSAGHIPWVADTSRFGKDWWLSFDVNRYDGDFVIGDKRIRLSHTHAVYWHRFAQPTLSGSGCRREITDVTSALNCWFHHPAIRWVNGLEAIRYHQCKPAQLHHAAQLGAQVPPTWVGNHILSATDFRDTHTSPVVKPVHGGELAALLGHDDETALAGRLACSPATLQAYIPGTNVRSYVVGDKLFHIELDTDHTDFRSDDALLPVITEVPQSVARLAVTLCRGLSMHWCAIDWRVTPDKQYYFLEANPCPYFLYVEQTTGLDITAALITLLTCEKRIKKAPGREPFQL